MKKNMGNTDRFVRALIALTIIALVATGNITGTLATILLIASGILILTSFISFCPLYAPFGLSTCKLKE